MASKLKFKKKKIYSVLLRRLDTPLYNWGAHSHIQLVGLCISLGFARLAPRAKHPPNLYCWGYKRCCDWLNCWLRWSLGGSDCHKATSCLSSMICPFMSCHGGSFDGRTTNDVPLRPYIFTGIITIQHGLFQLKFKGLLGIILAPMCAHIHACLSPMVLID